MTLHTVNLLPGDPACADCCAVLGVGDAVLFHGDGAWLARQGAPWLEQWAATGATLHVLAADLAACGLADACDPRIETLDAPGLVALSEGHARQRGWY